MAQIILISIILIVFYAISSIAKSIMDTVDFRFETSIFSKLKSEKAKLWWNQSEGWKNKYKDRDKTKGRAFPGSMTWLVWVTDAWHFFQMIMLTSYDIMIVTPIIVFNSLNWWLIFPYLIIAKLYRGGLFELFWAHVFKLKSKQ